MDIWQIVVIVVLAALILVWVAVIAYNKGRVSGRLAAEQDLSGDEDTHSLFGDDAPVRPTERRLIEVLPEALIVKMCIRDSFRKRRTRSRKATASLPWERTPSRCLPPPNRRVPNCWNAPSRTRPPSVPRLRLRPKH